MVTRLASSFLIHRGLIRKGNEDSILIEGTVVAGISMEHPEQIKIAHLPVLFCVADGIGGAAHGEVASRTVLKVFSRYSPIPELSEDIPGMIYDARSVLNGIALDNPSYTGFGTTVAGLILTAEQAIVFNCGDSRVYRIDGDKITRLSHDHSLVQELCDHGEITDDQMYTHPLRNIITSSVSGDPHRPEPHIMTTNLPVMGTERFLLCTDGVWEVIRDTELASLCCSTTMKQAVGDILATCLARGGPDNISLILVGPC